MLLDNWRQYVFTIRPHKEYGSSHGTTITDHVTAVCDAFNCHLYRLSSIRHYLTTEAEKNAVHALVTSRLDYRNSLLYNIPLSQTFRLQRVQNIAARLITRSSKHDHVTPELKELHWLTVESRILVMIYKCINSLAPSYLAELVQPRKHDGSLRQNYRQFLVSVIYVLISV